MGPRIVAILFVVGCGALSSSCRNSATAPTPANDQRLASSNDRRSPPNSSSASHVEIASMGISDAGRGAAGEWLYLARLYLRETGGVDVTVTNIQLQAFFVSKVLGSATSSPMLLVRANSRSDTAFVFAGTSQVPVTALDAHVTVQFMDATGETSSISSTFSCFGCWDY